MSDRHISVSTRQASELLGVHESSVKRWCNAEDLECWLTPGGHRRIPIRSLVAFARAQDLALPLRAFDEDAGRVWAGLEQARQAGAFDQLVDLTYGWIAQGRSRLPARLIAYLQAEGFTLGRILDRLVGPVMQRVGEGYTAGTVSIGDEHRMSQAMRNALVLLHTAEDAAAPPQGREQPVAVVGCARGEAHELGALMVRLTLEAEGWQVVYLGLNVPTEEFATQQIKHRATLLCISLMPPRGLVDARTLARLLDQMYDPTHPYRLAMGGSALQAGSDFDRTGLAIPDVQCFGKMEPFMTWIRTLA